VYHYGKEDERQATRSRFEKLAQQHPDKPTFSVLDARSLIDSDTPRAIDLLNLAGKTWKLTSLEGKTLLINVWASWCGPCRSEHPHLEKLYRKVKDRSDIQILTFNVDDHVGQVKPYMKEQKFTFPVLLAKNYVDELLPVLSIPRNWIVDANGKWRLEQIGFGNDADWEKLMMDKLESAKPSSAGPARTATEGSRRQAFPAPARRTIQYLYAPTHVCRRRGDCRYDAGDARHHASDRNRPVQRAQFRHGCIRVSRLLREAGCQSHPLLRNPLPRQPR
jgi:thiol-disulfide isomerase/thioredoxin